MKKRVLTAVCVCVGILGIAVWLSRNTGSQKKCQKQLLAMDTYMEFTAYGKNSEKAVDAAIEEVKYLDGLLSAQDENSEVYALNESGSLFVEENLKILLERGKELFQKTGGLYDDTIYPLMKLWGFPTGNYHVPSEAEIQKLLPLIDGSRIQISDAQKSLESDNITCADGKGDIQPTVSEETKGTGSNGTQITLGEGQQVDLGGLAKGYTGQKLKEIFQEYEVPSALVSLGGNVQAVGKKPDGSLWKIGIRNPEGGEQDYIGVLSVEDEAVVTSGGYERYFTENNEKYIHILDPRTGYPASGDLLSVTIVSEDGTLADGLSTALYIMGYEKACSFWREHQEEFGMILITSDSELHVSEDLKEQFQSEKSWQVIPIEIKGKNG